MCFNGYGGNMDGIWREYRWVWREYWCRIEILHSPPSLPSPPFPTLPLPFHYSLSPPTPSPSFPALPLPSPPLCTPLVAGMFAHVELMMVAKKSIIICRNLWRTTLHLHLHVRHRVQKRLPADVAGTISRTFYSSAVIRNIWRSKIIAGKLHNFFT